MTKATPCPRPVMRYFGGKFRIAAEIMKQFDGPTTLHYVDPPYKHEMLTEGEHEALLDLLQTLQGKVIVSGYDHAIYRTRLKKWAVREFRQRVQRNGQRKELTWLNYEPEAMLL